MDLLIVGINHHSAPVSLREKVAFTPDQLGHALGDLVAHAGLQEAAILSTCNRTEIIAVTDRQEPELIPEWLANYHHLPLEELMPSIYIRNASEAVSHLMRVASGLDSMVVGEPQILGQVKDCFLHAQRHRTMGPELNRLSQAVYHIAKRVRTRTAIGANSVSVASTSVSLATRLFSDMSACHALMIGAGDTIALVSRHLRNAGVNELTIANRTLEHAESLARELGAQAIDLTGIPMHLVNADIVIASTASQLPVLGKGAVERALKQRRHRPIFMVDLAVPRDIEPEVGDLRDVYLYSVDDLEEIINRNLNERKTEARRAEVLIEEAVTGYGNENRSRQAQDTLVRFRRKHEMLKEHELEKVLARLKSGEDPEKLLVSLANQLTNKIIHTPSIQMKEAGKEGRRDLLEIIEQLFDLDNDVK